MFLKYFIALMKNVAAGLRDVGRSWRSRTKIHRGDKTEGVEIDESAALDGITNTRNNGPEIMWRGMHRLLETNKNEITTRKISELIDYQTHRCTYVSFPFSCTTTPLS